MPLPYCPLCNEWHSGAWDCSSRKMGIITDDKGVVQAIGESETNTRRLMAFYAYETAEGMRLIDTWLTGAMIGDYRDGSV